MGTQASVRMFANWPDDPHSYHEIIIFISSFVIVQLSFFNQWGTIFLWQYVPESTKYKWRLRKMAQQVFHRIRLIESVVTFYCQVNSRFSHSTKSSNGNCNRSYLCPERKERRRGQLMSYKIHHSRKRGPGWVNETFNIGGYCLFLVLIWLVANITNPTFTKSFITS